MSCVEIDGGSTAHYQKLIAIQKVSQIWYTQESFYFWILLPGRTDTKETHALFL